MKKFACIFPGQGSQEVGMAGQLMEHPLSAEYFESANEALGFDLADLMKRGPAEELTVTYNAQPAILTTSIAAWAHLKNALGPDRAPSFVAGHSLGEFSALAASGALGFKDSVRLVRKRGEFMQVAVPSGVGAMAALIGGTDGQARSLVETSAAGEILDIANYNSPGQVVISGHAGAVQRAVEKSKDFGFKRAVPLSVSAPFHSKLMGPVKERFKEELGGYVFSTPVYPVVHNVTAEANVEPGAIPDLLARQIDSPVLWTQSVERMVREGVEVFIEVGHGSVLQGLVRKIVGQYRDWEGFILGVESPEDVDRVIHAID
jgi:[acyl-carrier-protein] S-malonyltransferase